MHHGEQSESRFDGLLAGVGVYIVRVFLVRAAARRNETRSYRLKISLGADESFGIPVPLGFGGLAGALQ